MAKSTSIDDQLKAKRAHLKVLNTAIAEREAYRKNQEQVINELVEAGNTQLMGLNHDIALATKELKEVKNDLRLSKLDLKHTRADMERQSRSMVIAYA